MTKGISLTQGKVAVVDDDMYEEINKHKWCLFKRGNTHYAVRGSPRENGKQHTIFMHRVILGLRYGDEKISDHINRNGLDNRRKNLRVVSSAVNLRNHRKSGTNTSGHIGVSWVEKINKWMAYIQANYKSINLGYYDNINDAIEARKQGEIEHWAE